MIIFSNPMPFQHKRIPLVELGIGLKMFNAKFATNIRREEDMAFSVRARCSTMIMSKEFL